MSNGKENKKINRYLKTNFSWIDSPKYREVMCSCKGIDLVFTIIRRYVVRDNTKYKLWKAIFNEYYCNKKLASSVTYDFLVEKTGLQRKTVAKCLNILEEAGFLTREKIIISRYGQYNVFVLGKRKLWKTEKGMETYVDFWLIDDVVDDDLLNNLNNKTLDDFCDFGEDFAPDF